MLVELRIENLLLIDRAELRPGESLNAITGETGAGKTMLAHSLDLLLGGKPRSGIVRPGADEAYVEGVFELPAGIADAPELADLVERVGLEQGGEVVLARRVSAQGRSRAYVQGRSATAADLKELGGRLVAFFGQHEHRRLTVAAAQLELLDGFCGEPVLKLREQMTQAHGRVRALARELEELREEAGTRDRDLGLLEYKLAEIDEVAPDPDEEAGLLTERERLRQVDGLRAAAAAGSEALAPDDGGDAGAVSVLAAAEAHADELSGADAKLDVLAERLRGLRLEADDLAGELRRYLDGLEADPERLQEVETRLDALDRLKRKHGGSIESVLEHAEHCRSEVERLSGAETALERQTEALSQAESERTGIAAELTAARAEAAPRLAEGVTAELEALAMGDAEFSVVLEPREEIGATGAERVELMLAPNPGVPAAPVREAGSGGELSRVMLALMTVAGARGAEVLVFDEVDAGVGGRTARAVGDRLRALGADRQVLCITHLPQIAALAERHFRISKTSEGDVVRTDVEALKGDAVVGELVRMLGSDGSDKGAREHAEELLAA